MGKHANKPHKPGRYAGLGPLQCNGIPVTTWPWQRKDKRGVQKPVRGMTVYGRRPR